MFVYIIHYNVLLHIIWCMVYKAEDDDDEITKQSI